jgi:hypothetical protein
MTDIWQKYDGCSMIYRILVWQKFRAWWSYHSCKSPVTEGHCPGLPSAVPFGKKQCRLMLRFRFRVRQSHSNSFRTWNWSADGLPWLCHQEPFIPLYVHWGRNFSKLCIQLNSRLFTLKSKGSVADLVEHWPATSCVVDSISAGGALEVWPWRCGRGRS